MRSLARWTSRRQPSDGIPPSPIPAPRRAPSWPRETPDVDDDPFWLPVADDGARRLPAEDPNLLTAYPAAAAHAHLSVLALLAAASRPGCRILDASREYEVAVGQNLAMLADQEHVAVTR